MSKTQTQAPAPAKAKTPAPVIAAAPLKELQLDQAFRAGTAKRTEMEALLTRHREITKEEKALKEEKAILSGMVLEKFAEKGIGKLFWEDITASKVLGKNEQVKPELLLNEGVSPAVIKRATVVKEYEYLLVTEKKKAAGAQEGAE